MPEIAPGYFLPFPLSRRIGGIGEETNGFLDQCDKVDI